MAKPRIQSANAAEIAQLEQRIKQLREQEKARMEKMRNERLNILGKALDQAIEDGYMETDAASMLLSRYINDGDVLSDLERQYSLNNKFYVPPFNYRGRLSPSARYSHKETVARGSTTLMEDLVNIGTGKAEDKQVASGKKNVMQSDADKTASVSRKQETKDTVGKTSVTRRKRASRQLVKPVEVSGHHDTDENDDDSYEDNSPQGKVLDTKIGLDKLEEFQRKGRILDKLASVNINILGDLTSRTEEQFSRIKGVNNGDVLVCKRILGDLGTGFRAS